MHKGFALWFTGLSGSGKSTLSERIYQRLVAAGAKVELLGGRDCKLRTENWELKIGVGAEVGAR